MINAIVLNIKSFYRRKTFKNYILLNVIICIFIFFILLVQTYSKNQINLIVNSNDNKTIFINNMDKKEDINSFISNFSSSIEKIEYSVLIDKYQIDENMYQISTDEIDFANDTYGIIINADYKEKSIIIDDLVIENIVYDNNIGNNVIFINQRLAKYFFEKGIGNNSILIVLKDYYDIDKTLNYLKEREIDANSNNTGSSDLMVYSRLYLIIKIILLFLIIVTVITTSFLSYNFLYEQRKDVIIFANLGYTKTNILLNYLVILSLYLLSSYLISFVLILILLCFLFWLKIDLFKCFTKIWFLPLLMILIINASVSTINYLFKIDINK
ncbi:MAG: hypothetical protein OSJ70_01720 [Bacilli bacterium]|nr:hypothetical protein [Bacilli bacterium]